MKYFKRYSIKNYSWFLVVTVIAISIFGVIIVGSAKESVQDRQFMGLMIGVVAMIVISLIDFNWILKYHWIWYVLGILLLLAVILWGSEDQTAQRWLEIGSFQFQPSEIVKIILIVFFAKFLMDKRENIDSFFLLFRTVLLFLFPISLIIIQPDLSTSLSMGVVFIVLIYMAGLSYKRIGIILLVGIPLLAGLLFYVVQPNQILLRGYQQERILSWLQPEENADDGAWQQENGKIAIASGQLTGKGLNNNTTTSVKNGNFISEPQTDFIFAIIGEELGFMGCCLVISLLLLIVLQCILIGIRCQIFAGKLICYGIASQIGFQAFMNMGVATGLLPNTGIPLPFVSYGLTSLVTMFCAIGIVLNIGLQKKKH